MHAEVEALEMGFGDPGSTKNKIERLSGSLLLNATQSEWQLLHVLTHFWNNHFHSQIDTLRMNFFSRERRGGSALQASEEAFATADFDGSGAISRAEWESFRTFFRTAVPWEDFQLESGEGGDPTADGELTLTKLLAHRRIASWKYPRGPAQTGVASDLERREYDTYRRLALGRFRDLLEAAAKSPSMLIYLNGFENTLQAPNENYAREFLELHALGVDTVYTQRDIEEVARVLTGWTVDWVERAGFAREDLNFTGFPEAPRFPIDGRVSGAPDYLAFPTDEFWDDATYTWAFVFGNSGRRGRFGDGHDWGRKDIFLRRFGGVDSLGNPLSPTSAVAIPENSTNQTSQAAMDEFDLLLGQVVRFRDCSKFICTKLIQLFVTDDLSLLRKTPPLTGDVRAAFDLVDTNGDESLDVSEWSEPVPLALPNGRPPQLFADLDANGDGFVTSLEYQEPDLLVEAMDTWRQSDGSIREVLRTVLHSDEFLSLKFYRAKVRTSFEVAAAASRGLEVTFNQNRLQRSVEGIQLGGNEMFRFADPTGESELAIDNMDTSKLLGRLQLLNRGARPVRNSVRPFFWDFDPVVGRWGLETSVDYVDYYSLLLLGGDILENQREIVLAASEGDLRTAVGLLLSLPQFQKQ